MQTGTCLGDRYTLEEHIGTGEHGSVWFGHDSVRDRPVRVKTLSPELSRDETIRERFRRTALKVVPLSIPGIVDVGDCVELHDGDDTIVCQIAGRPEGEPLNRMLRDRTTLELDKVMFTVADAAWALHEAHEDGVPHLNLKPANLIVGPEGSVTIVDFGFDLEPAPGAPARPYAAPEQLRGESAGVASDVFSLGVVAYECLTGTKPFDADTTSQLAAVHRAHQPVPLPSDVPQAAATVIMKALSKDPSDRFASAADLALACRQINFTSDVLGALLQRAQPRKRPTEEPEPTVPIRKPTAPEPERRDRQPSLTATKPRVQLPIVPEPKTPANKTTAPQPKDTAAASGTKAPPRDAATPPSASAAPRKPRRKRLAWVATSAVLVAVTAAAVAAASFIPQGPPGSAADGYDPDRDGEPGIDSTSSLTPGPEGSVNDPSSGGTSESPSSTNGSSPDPSDSDSESDDSDNPENPDEPDEPDRVDVPDVVGDSRENASQELQDAGLEVNVEYFGEGRFECNVRDQSPNAGAEVPPDTTVDIEVKRAKNAKDCERGVASESPPPPSQSGVIDGT